MALIIRGLRRTRLFCRTVLKQMYLYWGGRLVSILKKNKKHKEDYPIDFVVTWVDGSDPDWIKEKQKYSGQNKEQTQNTDARFRDWDTLVYWFRAVEKYAPWVNHIYLVTCGQKPSWLNLQNDRLRFVTHAVFMPNEYLPTFNSRAIELNMWRIPGLSEHFVYFNDDVFLNRPVKPEDFFHNGLPKECAIAKPLRVHNPVVRLWWHIILNDYSVINYSFNVKECIRQNPSKWFSYVIGSNVRYNRRLYYDGYLAGMEDPHASRAFLKRTFEDLWSKHKNLMDQTSRSRFRDSSNCSIHLVTFWMLFSGDFYPVTRNQLGKYFSITSGSVNRIVEELLSPKHNVICLNDDSNWTEDNLFNNLQQIILDAFSKKLPDKSSYEL